MISRADPCPEVGFEGFIYLSHCRLQLAFPRNMSEFRQIKGRPSKPDTLCCKISHKNLSYSGTPVPHAHNPSITAYLARDAKLMPNIPGSSARNCPNASSGECGDGVPVKPILLSDTLNSEAQNFDALPCGRSCDSRQTRRHSIAYSGVAKPWAHATRSRN